MPQIPYRFSQYKLLIPEKSSLWDISFATGHIFPLLCPWLLTTGAISPLYKPSEQLYTAKIGGYMIRLRVKEIARQKGISQTRLAHLAFLDDTRLRLIYRYPDSEHINLTLQVLDRLAKALGVDASELIESVPDTPSPD